MTRRRKKKHEDEHMDESWLVPYADILTLLLALFIVLFAMSSVDAQKFQLLSRAFNQMFTGGTGLLDFDSQIPAGNSSAKSMNQNIQNKDNYVLEDPETVKKNQEKKEAMKKDQEELHELQVKVNDYIANENLGNKLQTSLTSEGLLLTIRDNVLFDSGRAEVRSQDLNTASEIANLLVMDPPRNIIISGHTDNVPIKNSKYGSNWELSVMRAVNFMKIILENEKLDPRWFSAKGFGEFQPIAPNETPEGKAKNRRVEVLILPRVGE